MTSTRHRHYLGRSTTTPDFRSSYLTLLLVAALSVVGNAQGSSPDPLPRWDVTLYAGGVSHSHVSNSLGQTPDRGQYFLGVHAVAPVLRVGIVTLAYAPDVIPLYVMTNTPRYRREPHSILITSRGPAVAVGIAPFGVELMLGQRRDRLRAFAAGAVGALWFQRAVPDPNATSYNYTFQYDFGVILPVSGRTGVRAAWRYHHLSNLYRASSNPGVDGEFLWLGVERRF